MVVVKKKQGTLRFLFLENKYNSFLPWQIPFPPEKKTNKTTQELKNIVTAHQHTQLNKISSCIWYRLK